MERTGKETNADYAHRAGYIGNGVGVAIMDTGITKHPDFDHRIFWRQSLEICHNTLLPFLHSESHSSQSL